MSLHEQHTYYSGIQEKIMLIPPRCSERLTEEVFITVTNREDKTGGKEESFLDNRFRIVSRSGLNITETQIIEALKGLSGPKRILFLENRTGVSGMVANCLYPEAEITIHCLDLYYANKIRRNLTKNGVSSVTVYCKPYVEQKEGYDVIFLQLSRGGATKELVMDFIQQIHQALQPGGKCFFSLEGNDPWLQHQIKRVFGGFSFFCRSNTGYGIASEKKEKLKRVRNYEASFTMTIFRKKPIQLLTIPGVFSHREIDQGALALAEIAVGESQIHDAVLDMGCGCGAIGISIAVNQDVNKVCFVDSNSRALFITEKNCKRNGLERYEVLLRDTGIEQEQEFTLFTGNPPYFTHYKISELFISTAYKALKPGGRAYIVAKTAAWHHAYMKTLFGNAERIKRRGYDIIKSFK